jgi:hypothetical protein
LNTQQINVKFVHRLFTNEKKQQCVCVWDCLPGTVDQNFLLRAITSDKTRVCCYSPKTKQQSSGWKSLSYSCLKKVRQVRSNIKSMLVIFLNYEDTVHQEFVPPGWTLT